MLEKTRKFLESIKECMTELFNVEYFVDPVRLALMSVVQKLGPVYAYLDGTQTEEPTDGQVDDIAQALAAAKTASETAKDTRSAEIILMCLGIVEAYLDGKMNKK